MSGVVFTLLSAVCAHGASKDRQSASAEPKEYPTQASLAEVDRALTSRLTASVSVLQGLDAKAHRTRQAVPAVSGMLDNFRTWLSLKNAPKPQASGIYPKLERAYSSLRTSPKNAAIQDPPKGLSAGAAIKALASNPAGRPQALADVKSAHDDVLKYRKSADESLRSAVDELWRRGDKAGSSELDRFRKAMAAEMGEAARWLEEGLKAHSKAMEGYIAATLRQD